MKQLDRLKSEYNRNIDKMAEEIRQMEKVCNETFMPQIVNPSSQIIYYILYVYVGLQ